MFSERYSPDAFKEKLASQHMVEMTGTNLGMASVSLAGPDQVKCSQSQPDMRSSDPDAISRWNDPALEVPSYLAHWFTDTPCPQGSVALIYVSNSSSEAVIVKDEDELTADDKKKYKTELEAAILMGF